MSDDHQNDLYVVCNILVDDTSTDPEFGGSRADYFEVHYDRQPIRIPPGETRVLPKYLADHFAKHLIDYMLVRDNHMMHDDAYRSPLIPQIILRQADERERPSEFSPAGDRNGTEETPSIIAGDRKHGSGETVDPTVSGDLEGGKQTA